MDGGSIAWRNGANHYLTLGKSHRYNAMGGLVILDASGTVTCGCGLGITRVTPRAAVEKH